MVGVVEELDREYWLVEVVVGMVVVDVFFFFFVDDFVRLLLKIF